MRRSFSIYFLMLFLSSLCVQCSDLRSNQAHAPTEDKVINGTFETQEASVVALVYGDTIKCTGTVIAPQTVLTAAHCIYVDRGDSVPTPPDQIQVIVNDEMTEMAYVSGFAMHDQWSGQFTTEILQQGNDIALLYLDRVLSVDPVELDTSSPQTHLGQVGKIVGFGKTDAWSSRSAGRKHQVSLKVHAIFGTQNNLLELISADEEYRGACHGDSGGPFFTYTQKQKRLTGITSYGSSYCDQSSKYVSTAFHNTWIKDNLTQRTTGIDNVEMIKPMQSSPTYTCFQLLVCLGKCNEGESCSDYCYQLAASEIQTYADQLIQCNHEWKCFGDNLCLTEYCQQEVVDCDPSLLDRLF